MEKITTALLFEICSFLLFKDMIILTYVNKHYYKKMKEILIIFSEREAQRLLISKCTLLRNPFIEQENPLNTLANNNWYEFMKEQVNTRKWLKMKLWTTLPLIFKDENDDEVNIKLIQKLFQEIKKPSESPPKLLKTNNSIAIRTSFQALLYGHKDMKNKLLGSSIVDEVIASSVIENDIEFVSEIIDNNEQIWLEDFRWYRDKLEVVKPPKSSILGLLFGIEGLIKGHGEVAHQVIQGKRNTENFLDEYGTRWISYSDLIMIMEEELSFLEDSINSIYNGDLIEKDKNCKSEFIPRYSILRMMCRIWGKYVMK